MDRPRILFFGSGAFAVPALRVLIENEYPLLGVVTQPDKPAGRGMRLVETPVKQFARTLSLPIYMPVRCRAPEFIEQVRALAPDLIVLASYGQILPAALLEIAPLGNFNIHASLLPKYRGASPIQYALLNGEQVTGVTIIEMVAELDAGDIYLQEEEPIQPDDTYGSLEPRLAQLGAKLLLQTLDRLQAGTLKRTPQDHSQATYAPMIKKEDTLIRWEEPATRCHNRIRAFSPKPGVATFWKGKMVKLWRTQPHQLTNPPTHQLTNPPSGTVLQADAGGILVACGEGALRLLELQPEGKARMSARDFINGYRVKVGDRFGENDKR